jgi:hypothetical protein
MICRSSMTSTGMTPPRRQRQHGWRAITSVARPFALAAAGLVGAIALSPAAAAAGKVCGERTQILERLQQRHDETPKALGLSSDGGVLEVLVSPEGGWTILVTYPKKPTCVVAVGEAWQPLTLVGQEA